MIGNCSGSRVIRVLTRAEEALGDGEKAAARWLRKSNRALGGKRPLDFLESDIRGGSCSGS